MKLSIIIILMAILSGCEADKWKAQTCNSVTQTCSKMSYGPYTNLDTCVEQMKKLKSKFTCAKNCSGEDSPVCDTSHTFLVEKTTTGLKWTPQ